MVGASARPPGYGTRTHRQPIQLALHGGKERASGPMLARSRLQPLERVSREAALVA
jgi:hypothetical protein